MSKKKLPVGTILNVLKVQKDTFQERIPYKGIYFQTNEDISLEEEWCSLSTPHSLLKFFVDTDTMKQKLLNSLKDQDQYTVETLLDISTRLDIVEAKLQMLSSRAVTSAKDINKESFWYEQDDVTPMELVIPSYAKLRFDAGIDNTERMDIVIKRDTDEEGSRLWKVKTPLLQTAQIKDLTEIPTTVLNVNQHFVQGRNIQCTGRYQHWDSSNSKLTDIFSYTEENGTTGLMEYPISKQGVFDQLIITAGEDHCLYLNDPNTRIKIKKPKEIVND